MKSSLCAIPAPYSAQLTAIAPSIAFSVSRQIDPSYTWDGDGADPVNDGFDAYDVMVRARAIVRGQLIEGSAHLGGSYFRADEPTGEIHGYLAQMLDEAADELHREAIRLGGDEALPLGIQILSVTSYLKTATLNA